MCHSFYLINITQFTGRKYTAGSIWRLVEIVAIDTSFGKRSLIIKVKTKAIIEIMFAQYFEFYHNFIVRQSEKNNH